MARRAISLASTGDPDGVRILKVTGTQRQHGSVRAEGADARQGDTASWAASWPRLAQTFYPAATSPNELTQKTESDNAQKKAEGDVSSGLSGNWLRRRDSNPRQGG